MMTFRGKRRARGGYVKNSIMPDREENCQEEGETKTDNKIIPSLREKVMNLEDELKLKDNKLQTLDNTIKCLEKQLEVKNNKCMPSCEEERPTDNELANMNDNEKLKYYEKELETTMNKLKCLEDEVKLSNDKLISANEKVKNLENDLELKNSTFDSTTQEINNLKKQLKLKTSELNSSIDENKCLEIEIEIKNNSIVSTKEKIECLEKENKVKSSEYESMKKKLHSVNKQLEQKSKELKLIKEDIKFMKNCYNKAVAKRDRATNTEPAEKAPSFIPKKDKSAQTPGNQFICSTCNKSLVSSGAETQTCMTDFPHPAPTEGMKGPGVTKEIIPDMRKKSDEAIASDPNYIYIKAMKVYYSSSTGYYYDPETGINTDSATGTKYVYCPATQTYRLFIPKTITQQTLIKHLEEQSAYKKRKRSMPEKPSKVLKSVENEAEMEEFDNNDGNSEDSKSFLENEEMKNCNNIASMRTEKSLLLKGIQNIKSVPPSIRCIVLESETLQQGSLLLVTYTGVIIGREMNCTMCIPDSDVSETHAKIDFDTSANCYVITDLGSENGTYVNDHRLSMSFEQSKPHCLNHEDSICIANCKLLIHIHNGKETCNNCEPGQVYADLISKLSNKNSEIVILSKEEKEKERKKELKKLKKRFGLNNAYYEVEKLSDIENLGYKDLAKERQRTKGSDNPYEKTEVQSLDESLTVKNKGFRLLQKMGWSEGEGLGKTSSGRTEPVPIPSAVPTTSMKKKPRVMSKAAMRNFQREISLLSGNTKLFTQPPVSQSKVSEKNFTPVNFVAGTPVQINEQEIPYSSEPTLSPTDFLSQMVEQPADAHEPSLPPIDFLSKLIDKPSEVSDVPAPTVPPTDFLCKLVEKQPEVNDVPVATSSPSDSSKSVEQKPETNDVSVSTLPPTDFLSKLMKKNPKKKRRCREMIDGYVDPATQS